jgi:hypothetical protein
LQISKVALLDGQIPQSPRLSHRDLGKFVEQDDEPVWILKARFAIEPFHSFVEFDRRILVVGHSWLRAFVFHWQSLQGPEPIAQNCGP